MKISQLLLPSKFVKLHRLWLWQSEFLSNRTSSLLSILKKFKDKYRQQILDSESEFLACRKSLFWNKSNPQQALFSSTISGRSNFLIHFLGIIPKEGSAGQVWDSWTSQNVLFSLKIFLQRKVTKQFLNVPKGTCQKRFSGFCPLRGGGTPPFR